MDEVLIDAYMTYNPELTRDQAIAALADEGGGKNQVYLGSSKKQGLISSSDIYNSKFPKAVKTPDTVGIEEMYLRFWTDKKTKAKAMALLNSQGRQDLGELGAYQLWKNKVDESAEIYAGGKGYKITPYELSDMSIRSMNAASLPESDTTKYVSKTTDAQKIETLDAQVQNYLGRRLTEDETKELLASVRKMEKKGTITTTKVDPKTGKKTVTQEDKYTPADVTALVEDKFKGTEDYIQKQSLDFMGFLSKLGG